MATNLASLITLTRRRSNQENNFFCSDDELTVYLNNSLAELDDILVTDYEDYRLNTFQSVLPSDGVTNVIPIPSTLYKLRGVDYQLPTSGSPYWITLFPYQLTERNRNRSGGLANIIIPYRTSLSYRLGDAGIIIMPQIQAGGTFQIWYTPKFIPLSAPTDSLTIQMDTQAWIEYAVVDCCIKIFNKQNLDPSGFLAEKSALQLRIRNAAKNRDSAAPKRMANVRFNDETLGIPNTFYNY